MKQNNGMLLALGMLVSSSILIAADPIFHLKNNSKDAIDLDIIQRGKSKLRNMVSIKKGGDFKLDTLDTKEDTVLDIYFCPTSCKTEKAQRFTDTITASFVDGKKIYIKFDGKKIVPQKGNKLGLTTKGYSVKNNVTEKDILTPEIIEKPAVKTSPEAIQTEFDKNKPQSKPQVQQKPAKPTAPKPTKVTPPAATSAVEENLSGTERTNLAWEQFPEALKIKKATTTPSGDFNKWNAYAAVLGVDPKEGTKSDFKKAYSKLSLKWHPDKNQGSQLATDVFQLINDAYKYLTN